MTQSAASQNNAKIVHLENQLKEKTRHISELTGKIERLNKEVSKANFAPFFQGQGEIVSTTAGRLPAVAGVREISMSDI